MRASPLFVFTIYFLHIPHYISLYFVISRHDIVFTFTLPRTSSSVRFKLHCNSYIRNCSSRELTLLYLRLLNYQNIYCELFGCSILMFSLPLNLLISFTFAFLSNSKTPYIQSVNLRLLLLLTLFPLTVLM